MSNYYDGVELIAKLKISWWFIFNKSPSCLCRTNTINLVQITQVIARLLRSLRRGTMCQFRNVLQSGACEQLQNDKFVSSQSSIVNYRNITKTHKIVSNQITNYSKSSWALLMPRRRLTCRCSESTPSCSAQWTAVRQCDVTWCLRLPCVSINNIDH